VRRAEAVAARRRVHDAAERRLELRALLLAEQRDRLLDGCARRRAKPGAAVSARGASARRALSRRGGRGRSARARARAAVDGARSLSPFEVAEPMAVCRETPRAGALLRAGAVLARAGRDVKREPRDAREKPSARRAVAISTRLGY